MFDSVGFKSIKRFLSARQGNVAIIFALALVPTLFGLGMAVDYSMAARRRASMNAAADAAALSAVTPAMMLQSTTAAQQRALSIFNAQSGVISGVYSPSVQVTVTETPVNNLRRRTATVTYTAWSTNAFGGILNSNGIQIGNGSGGSGGTQASATVAANIDFYLMIDTSPSMAIAATQSDINTMLANTPGQDTVTAGNPNGGCAFACHEGYPQGEAGAVKKNGKYIDNYQLATNLNVTRRIDLVQKAIGDLITSAQNAAATYKAAYRLAGYGFDLTTRNVFRLTSVGSLDANSTSSGFQLMMVWSNNILCGNSACTTQGTSNSDQDTDLYTAFQTVYNDMPIPGTGSNNPGDTPQEVLFVVTDAVGDTSVGGSRGYPPMGQPLSNGTTWCDSIKNKGIRIAVLYTSYLPLPTNDWYVNQVRPVQDPTYPQQPPQDKYRDAAKACASSGLFAEVQTGGDISAALVTLFQMAIASAHLTQ